MSSDRIWRGRCSRNTSSREKRASHRLWTNFNRRYEQCVDHRNYSNENKKYHYDLGRKSWGQLGFKESPPAFFKIILLKTKMQYWSHFFFTFPFPLSLSVVGVTTPQTGETVCSLGQQRMGSLFLTAAVKLPVNSVATGTIPLISTR